MSHPNIPNTPETYAERTRNIETYIAWIKRCEDKLADDPMRVMSFNSPFGNTSGPRMNGSSLNKTGF